MVNAHAVVESSDGGTGFGCPERDIAAGSSVFKFKSYCRDLFSVSSDESITAT